MPLLVSTSFFHLLLSCFLAAITTRTSDAAAGAAQLQASNCSTEGNYTATDDYAANLNQLLATLPSTTVSKNGGFFNGTVGQGAATAYGLALCSADFSRSDCDDCLTAASSSASGLVKRCPGSVTASIVFDQCMLRYSNRNFFGNNETDIIFTFTSSEIVPFRQALSNNLKQGLAYLSAQAALSPERFAASGGTAPYALVQCTWDLPPDKCKACIDTLSANASDLFQVGIEGELKSYTCRVRYSNASFTVVPLVAPAPTMNRSADPTGGPGPPPPSSAGSSRKSNNKAIVAGAVAVTVIVVGTTMIVALICITRENLFGYGKLPANKTKGDTQTEDATSAAQHREEGANDATTGMRGSSSSSSSPPALDRSNNHMNNSNKVEIQIQLPVHVVAPAGANAIATTGMTGSNNSGASSSAMEPAAQQQQEDEGANNATTGSNSSSSAPKFMSLESLKSITNNFSEQQKLGSGSFGTVYKGVQNGKEIAVKLLHPIRDHDYEQEFIREFDNLRRLRHPNIVQLLGYCYESKAEKVVRHKGRTALVNNIYRALCFEYMHNGSLQRRLDDEVNRLDWPTCYKIIKGTCEGLKYLHDKSMCHLDLKPGNVLLDTNMEPKIADLGLSKLVCNNQTQATSSFSGTRKYCPPEYIKQGYFSNKFDIFSLGVVMIDIIAGSKGYGETAVMSSQEFIDHVKENWRQRLQATTGLESVIIHQVETCIEIALRCINTDRSQRPEIGHITSCLNEIKKIM